MSTKEEALKKAMDQKEDLMGRGESLRQVVEEAVRKALDGALHSEVTGGASTVFSASSEPSTERKVPEETYLPKETEHSHLWYKGVNSIAVNIKLNMGEEKKGGILFASSVSGEGTTTLCYYVSLALARVISGQVLLLDCNAQNPEIHKLFDAEPSPGLTEILMEKINWEDAVRKTNLKNYYVLPFGSLTKEPFSILGSEVMEGLLNALRTDFDFIFLDASPILGSAETEMLAHWVEAVVLIIKAQSTRREVALRAVKRISRHREFLGAILNQQDFIIPQFLYKRLK